MVDDDERIVSAIQRAAARSNVRVVGAADGAMATEIATHERLDGAVVDLFLADGRYGLDVVSTLRRLHPRLPILIASGRLTTDRVVWAVRSGADAVLEKPFTLAEVLDRLDHGPPAPTTPDRRTVEEVTARHVVRVFEDCEGNVSEAARRLDVQRSTVRARIAESSTSDAGDEPKKGGGGRKL